MDVLPEIRREDMPRDMRLLLDMHPRESWEAHPGFRDKTRHWLAAHAMFRKLAEQSRRSAEAMIDDEMDVGDFAKRIAFFGGHLVNNLHGHHGWEDRSFFPELALADPRFERGLDLLEKDHADLDVVLDHFTRHANRAIKLAQLDQTQVRDEAALVQQGARTIEAFLARHLTDEEDLAVPIILQHRLRG